MRKRGREVVAPTGTQGFVFAVEENMHDSMPCEKLGVLKNADDLPKLAPSMGQNVLLNLITPVLIGVGFILGKFF